MLYQWPFDTALCIVSSVKEKVVMPVSAHNESCLMLLIDVFLVYMHFFSCYFLQLSVLFVLFYCVAYVRWLCLGTTHPISIKLGTKVSYNNKYARTYEIWTKSVNDHAYHAQISQIFNQSYHRNYSSDQTWQSCFSWQ